MLITIMRLLVDRSKSWTRLVVLVSLLLTQGTALADSSAVNKILDTYTFVADFNQKEETREVSREVFWRYPYVLPKVEFPLKIAFDDVKTELPATKGEGRAVDHLNRGRLYFLDGKYDEAKATWLGARARFANRYPFHRRDDYFIGYAFLNIADQMIKQKGMSFDDPEVRAVMSNAGTFLSWAFIVKVDTPDPLIDAVTPKGLYTLASLYWRYNRFAGAFGAATTGLNFLRKTGRNEYRPQFHRFTAEAYIKNRSYLEAIQELDTAIRQDRVPVEAAAAFARVGDIYFDLNNYELAEDAYDLAAKVDKELQQINPTQLVLRGESLFWLGKFSEAQKVFHFAIDGINYRSKISDPLTSDYLGWASLRIADAYLAQKNYDKAKLEYFKVGHEFRSKLPGRLALIREACLELPFYQGHNIEHARVLLEEAKVGEDIPPPAKELAWACQVGSYTDRERTAEMLQRVAQFADAYPQSDFLKSFAEPVRSYQATQIERYYKAGDTYRFISFFEKNRKTLFSKISQDLAERLFAAYADVGKSASAAEFWGAYQRTPDSDLKRLRLAVVAAELGVNSKEAVWRSRDQQNQKNLFKYHWTIEPSKFVNSYVTRMQQVASSSGQWLWLLNLIQHFGEKDPNYVCDLEYPALSRLNAQGQAFESMVADRTTFLINKLMPDLFKTDSSCALSLLDLEAEHLKKLPAPAIAKTYLNRQGWPLEGEFLHQYWTISEYLNDNDAKNEAKQLWQVIQDKGAANTPEVKFAKARLDPTRTEFEKLWD